LIERAFAQFRETGDFPLEMYAEDLVFVTRPELTGGTEWRGQDGLLNAMRDVGESWAELKPYLSRLDELDDERMVMAIHFELRGHSGIELEVDEWWALWMRDGLFARMEQYGTAEEARSAFER
jgi:hypothetical protein